MKGRIRGAEVLVEGLRRAGVGTVFTLSGNHIMPVFDALFGRGTSLIHTRHEAAAVHMADAWGRLTGEAGIALVTGGQGHANAVAGLATALAGEVPLVLLSGHAPLAELGLGAFQELDNAALAAPVAKGSWVARSAAGLAGELARAVRLARGGRPGPVHLGLPTDVLEAEVDASQVAWPQAADFAPEPLPLPPRMAAAVVSEIAAARRPLVLAPPALCTPSGRARLAALRNALGIPVVPMESPRGVNDPSLGAFPEVLAEADLILLLGKALDFTLRFGRPPAVAKDCRWIVLDPEPALLARAARLLPGRLALAALSGAAEAAAALAEAAQGSAGPHTGWTVQAEAAIAHRPAAWEALRAAAEPIHPVALCAALQPHLARSPEAVLVCDGGEIGQWAQSLLSAPTRIINGVAGAIGAGLPFALAARAARPGAPVLAVMGDGSFGFHMAEFDTACRHGLPFVAVVGNDSRWNAEYQIQLRDYGAERAHGCALAPGTRYDLAAAALGGHGEFVERAADLPAALERAFASDRPACVNVLIAGEPAPVVRRA
ncbi:thiamine pyrophosphate-binding protein [Crenalkalicoccus roseus]|uniref:thiamine pyrophosphate-binding protein n=1 Tax=Crenalkalicoccus roseus TaxID=1485588 RepID=UPI00108079BD|nr:thiamine pyrophosphate-binding protein [Crenalkalicoccus roseus]